MSLSNEGVHLCYQGRYTTQQHPSFNFSIEFSPDFKILNSSRITEVFVCVPKVISQLEVVDAPIDVLIFFFPFQPNFYISFPYSLF